MSSQLLFSAVMQIGASFGVSTVITTLVGFPTSQYSADTIVTYIMDIGTTRFEMGYAWHHRGISVRADVFNEFRHLQRPAALQSGLKRKEEPPV